MAKSIDTLRENETVILFNESDDLASLWTASAAVRREWESYGFVVQGDKRGWRAECPKDRISYRMLKKG